MRLRISYYAGRPDPDIPTVFDMIAECADLPLGRDVAKAYSASKSIEVTWFIIETADSDDVHEVWTRISGSWERDKIDKR